MKKQDDSYRIITSPRRKGKGMSGRILNDISLRSYYQFVTNRILHDAGEFPWHRDLLESPCPFNEGKLIKETHFPFLGLPTMNGVPLTVAKWRDIFPLSFSFPSGNLSYLGQPHMHKTTLELRWYLMLTDIIPGSVNKTPGEQMKMIPSEYELPLMIEEVTKSMLIMQKTGYFPSEASVRCAERTIRTRYECGGHFPFFTRYSDGRGRESIALGSTSKYIFRFCGIGVGASRKP